MKNTKLMSFGRIVAVSSALLVGCAYLAGCGDKTTEVTENMGLVSVEKGEKMPECTADNDGHMVYATDSAMSYVCVNKKWRPLKGADGEAGASCTANALKDKSGFELVCGGQKVGTIKNGENGEDGSSCSAKALKDKSGFDLICDGKKVGTIKNGQTGEGGEEGASCEGKVDKKNGSITIYCDGEKVGTLENGKDGDEGKTATELGCTAEETAAKDGYNIVCNGEIKGFVKNGKNGKTAFEIAQDVDESLVDESDWLASLKDDGCTLEDKDGEVVITCGEKTISFGKGLCADYDPEVSFCDTRDHQIYTYKTITINKEGNKPYAKTWMTQNLNYQITDSWCGGGNVKIEGDCAIYGRLYRWETAMNNSKAGKNGYFQGICPDGWHLPSRNEFAALIDAVNTSTADHNNAAYHLKADSDLWKKRKDLGDYRGIDTYGFAVLPAGWYGTTDCDECIEFSGVGLDAELWSSTEFNEEFAYDMGFDQTYASLGYRSKGFAHSIRCVKD